MWPWEHAGLGYLGYSLGLRVLGQPPPSDRETLILVIATILPDLIDKPLSWGLGLVPSGHAVAHSIFVAIPVTIAILLLAARRDWKRSGVAAVLGHWSHLVGDILTPIRSADPPNVRVVLWPVVEISPYQTDYGLRRGLVYFSDFLESLAGADPVEVVVLYGLLPALTLGLWVRDGAPGSSRLRNGLKTVWNAVQ